ILLACLATFGTTLIASPASAKEGPVRIALPNGFSPEDIAAGRHSTFYVGSLSSGAIFQGNFRTGSGHLLVNASDGPTPGLFLQRRDGGHDLLWAAGGPSGQARVYDASTGALLHTYHLVEPNSGAFVSDVIVTDTAAYYTDSFVQQMYVIHLGDGSD